MLYRIVQEGDGFKELEPVEFKDFASVGKLEKDLENLIANSILDVLFEDFRLMPVFQERQRQAEADIYALDEKGDLTIFELKRAAAGEGALHQALRYSQDAGQWSYKKLETNFRKYSGSDLALVDAHKDAFNLEHSLEPKDLNQRQHLIIIGSASDDKLNAAVDYWKKSGLSIDFLPYRIYEFGAERYFEFFSKPYDKHKNPGDAKGVLFDTNRTWGEDLVWSMIENRRIEAYGDAKRYEKHVNIGDTVFLSHRYRGLVAAARVKGEVKVQDEHTWSRYVEFLTPTPEVRGDLPAMPFAKVTEITGKKFYWARTIKVPYLSKDEAAVLAEALTHHLTGAQDHGLT